MQTIFRLSWCSDALGIEASKPDMTALHNKPSRDGPQVDFSLLNKLKRKRSDSAGPTDLSLDREIKRQRPLATEVHLPHDAAQTGSHQQWQSHVTDGEPNVRRDSLDTAVQIKADSNSASVQEASPDVMSDHVSAPHNTDEHGPLASAPIVQSELSPIQQAIEHQFNLEIMVKHRELRLIEQELAKCQAALEQLRRCEVMPYPGLDGLSLDVSAGTGPALHAPAGYSQPSAPAPWGVVDGPYSRHYSQWLLPDPNFDPQPPASALPQEANTAIRGDGRPVRSSFGSWAKPVKSRTQRESISYATPDAAHAAASAPTARNKGGPLVLKRMSDNQFVKLVCTKCHRSDFSSVQGFLNHCRIAHKIDYKSHEAAAQDCGHALGDHEAELAATAPPPVGSTVRAAAPKPAPPPPVTTKVHQMNYDKLPGVTWKAQRKAYIERINNTPTAPVAIMSSMAPSQAAGPLVPSEAQPFLSARLAQQGMTGIDLAAIVARLGEKIDFEPELEDMDDSVISGDVDISRPDSRKGFHQAGNRPRPAPIHTPQLGSQDDTESLPDHDLSPRTADSNPGMVSDHDDDMNSDPEDGASVIAGRDELHLPRGCGDAMDLDLIVDDDSHDHAVIIRARDSMQSDSDLASPSRARDKFGRRE